MIINWLSRVRKIRKVELDISVDWGWGGGGVHLLTTVFCLLLSLFGEMVKKWRGEGREIDLPVTQTESLTWSGKSQGMSLAIQNELNVDEKSGKCLPHSFFLCFFFQVFTESSSWPHLRTSLSENKPNLTSRYKEQLKCRKEKSGWQIQKTAIWDSRCASRRQ